jgi:hypothetical protein
LLSIRSERSVRQIDTDINNVVRFVHGCSPSAISSGITYRTAQTFSNPLLRVC